MKPDDEILDRWGLIADHLQVSEMTARRYLKRGLPITYDPAGHPITTKGQLDNWRFGQPRTAFFEIPKRGGGEGVKILKRNRTRKPARQSKSNVRLISIGGRNGKN